jgi:hypothetical protein
MSETPGPDRDPKRNGQMVKAAALVAVNQGILSVVRDSFNENQNWEFFCECGRDDCNNYVSLTLDAYVALQEGGGAVLAEGHRVSKAERGRRFGEDADALEGQADHQLKRATN